jgi:adenosyl cobinamide kinase/adenosyl cobinamide phosphate guanylyltransferase
LEYSVWRVQVNQDGLKFNDKYQLLVYANDVNILGGSVRTVKKNTEALVIASNEIGLEVNPDETKCMVMFRDQNAGRSHTMKIDSKSLEMVEEIKYLNTTLMNQSSVQE